MFSNPKSSKHSCTSFEDKRCVTRNDGVLCSAGVYLQQAGCTSRSTYTLFKALSQNKTVVSIW